VREDIVILPPALREVAFVIEITARVGRVEPDGDPGPDTLVADSSTALRRVAPHLAPERTVASDMAASVALVAAMFARSLGVVCMPRGRIQGADDLAAQSALDRRADNTVRRSRGCVGLRGTSDTALQ